MLLFIAFAVSIGLIVILGVAYTSISGLAGAVPRENRLFLDPLPKSLRPLWPLVNFVVHHFGDRFSKKLVDKTDLQLRLTSLTFLMNARQFIALSIIASVLAVFIALVLMLALGLFSVLVLIGAAILGYFYPRIWTRDVRRRRVAQILKHLPIYLDFLTLAVEAGLNINGALRKAVGTCAARSQVRTESHGSAAPFRRPYAHQGSDESGGRRGASRTDGLGSREVTSLSV
jgi:tight adherence protein C